MKLIVNPHKIEIEKEPVNEKEIDITKCEFEFADEITDEFVKDVYFTLKGETYQIANIQNNECDIPYEVLEEKGDVEVGVVAYKVENGNEIKRYNPSPAYFNTWVGSLKDEYENYEKITPSDKEQIEQQLLEISAEMDNLDVEASKTGHTTTITITRKDGTSYDVEVLDGEKGDKGDKGEPGAIKMQIVNVLPETGAEDTIYLVPIEEPETGNNYDEYIYTNGQWEKLGGVQVQVDLTDYVKNTDYATTSKAGVFKTANGLLVSDINGGVYGQTKTYQDYSSLTSSLIICKGTLENVITGKGLVSNTSYASANTGGVIKVGNYYNINSSGLLYPETLTYATYSSAGNGFFISKGTLENVLNEKIGNIELILTALDIGSGARELE